MTMIKSKHAALIKLMLVSGSVSRPSTSSRPCVWETQHVFYCFHKLCSAAVCRARTPQWQQLWLAGVFFWKYAYWPGLSVFSVSQTINLHSPPASLLYVFSLSVRNFPADRGRGKRWGSVCSCVCEQVKLALQRELEGVVRRVEREREKEGDDERQAVDEQKTDGEKSKANGLRACVMLSVVCAVLIQVNPAGTSTYGRLAQPSRHSIIPYGRQIKGWDLKNKLHDST